MEPLWILDLSYFLGTEQWRTGFDWQILFTLQMLTTMLIIWLWGFNNTALVSHLISRLTAAGSNRETGAESFSKGSCKPFTDATHWTTCKHNLWSAAEIDLTRLDFFRNVNGESLRGQGCICIDHIYCSEIECRIWVRKWSWPQPFLSPASRSA